MICINIWHFDILKIGLFSSFLRVKLDQGHSRVCVLSKKLKPGSN